MAFLFFCSFEIPDGFNILIQFKTDFQNVFNPYPDGITQLTPKP